MHHLSENPNVVRIQSTYEDATSVHLVMELCEGGELFERIAKKGHHSEREAAKLTKTIVAVIEACHSLGVMHRDLKPENFLFSSCDEDASIKSIDFGLSVFCKPGLVLILSLHDCVVGHCFIEPFLKDPCFKCLCLFLCFCQVQRFLNLLEVHTMWHLRFYVGITTVNVTYGALELSFTCYYVVFLLSMLVRFFLSLLSLYCSVSVSLVSFVLICIQELNVGSLERFYRESWTLRPILGLASQRVPRIL